ncbi:putative ribonuclease III [Pillotina sp. SPG140]
MSLKQYVTHTTLSNLNENELPPIDAARLVALETFQKSLNICFYDIKLLNLALTHRSVSNESQFKENNERLEFLGDAILGAVTAAVLYKYFPDKTEGSLAKIKSILVSESTLCEFAIRARVNTVLLLGHGEECSGGRMKPAILADTLEALFAALYLDSGYETVQKFIALFIEPELDKVAKNPYEKDYKSLLQEWTQRTSQTIPCYQLLSQSGVEHNLIFSIEVEVEGTIFGPGIGKSKKRAEQEAAKLAYISLVNAFQNGDCLN